MRSLNTERGLTDTGGGRPSFERRETKSLSEVGHLTMKMLSFQKSCKVLEVMNNSSALCMAMHLQYQKLRNSGFIKIRHKCKCG